MNKVMKMIQLRHKFYVDNPDLGSQELHMLEHLAILENAGYPLTITEAMQLKIVGSPATLWRYIDSLIQHGYLKAVQENNDRRTKYLHMTSKARRYFQKLEQLIERTK